MLVFYFLRLGPCLQAEEHPERAVVPGQPVERVEAGPRGRQARGTAGVGGSRGQEPRHTTASAGGEEEEEQRGEAGQPGRADRHGRSGQGRRSRSGRSSSCCSPGSRRDSQDYRRKHSGVRQQQGAACEPPSAAVHAGEGAAGHGPGAGPPGLRRYGREAPLEHTELARAAHGLTMLLPCADGWAVVLQS